MSLLLNLYSVYDAGAESYITPFLLPTDEMALRQFGFTCSDDTHAFGTYSHDYSLFKVGDFDTKDGTINAITPKLLATGFECRAKYKKLRDSYELDEQTEVNDQ
jgi:hypothetical protein